MNSINTMILTSIVNIIITALVGGIVVYRLQKKIDSTFQKSLFEYQIKFSRTYPKTLEILEAYRQKYYKCFRLLADYISVIQDMFLFENKSIYLADLGRVNLEKEKLTIDDGALYDKQAELYELAREFSQTYFDSISCLRENRLYLSDEIYKALEDMEEKAHPLIWILMRCMALPNLPLKMLFPEGATNTYFGKEILKKFSNELTSAVLLGELHRDFDELVKEVEMIYKSVAETD